MSTPNASRSRGVHYLSPPGEIVTVLTERPELLRTMLLKQVHASGHGIAQAICDEEYYVQRGQARKGTEKAVIKRMVELQECLTILAQVGWR